MKQLLECLHQILGNCKHVTELSNCYEYFWGIQGFLIYLVKNVWKIVNSPSFIFLLNYLFNLISFQIKFSTKLALLQYEDTVAVDKILQPGTNFALFSFSRIWFGQFTKTYLHRKLADSAIFHKQENPKIFNIFNILAVWIIWHLHIEPCQDTGRA